VEHDSSPGIGSTTPPATDAEDDIQGMKDFVTHDLAAHGYELCARNARVVVAALATAGDGTDWSALEHHVDGTLDRARLRPAA
jgi:hypothetical protein